MRTQNENKPTVQTAWSAEKREWPRHDSLKLCIWLVERIAQVSGPITEQSFFHPYIENCSQKESWDCIDCIRNKYIYFGLPLHHWMSTTTWVTFMEFRVCQTTVGGFRLKIWYTLWVLSLQEMNGRRLWVKFERFSGHIFWNLQNIYFCSQVNPNPNPPPPSPTLDGMLLDCRQSMVVHLVYPKVYRILSRILVG